MPSHVRAGAALAASCVCTLALAQSPAAPSSAPDAGVDEPGVSRFVPPRLLERVEAAYPEAARKQGLTGTVLLQIVVGVDGSVTDAQVAHPAGHGFDESALAAAKQLRFEPATQNGQPVAVQLNYEVLFALHDLPTIKDTAGATKESAPPEGGAPPYDAVVEAERPFSAASARTVRDRDFLMRPRNTPEDILRVVPGLVLAQHQGGGKADQIFLRGFDADHGTDAAVYLDGIPINMPSHAHGQGYTDLHFLIPEAISRVDITKGPYEAQYGDFDTAGAVNLVTRDTFDQSQVTASGGSFETYRVLGVAAPPPTAGFKSWFVGEVYGTQGPFTTGEQLERYNLFAKTTYDFGAKARLSLLANAYASSWVGSGQNPERLVDAGFLDRYGAIDPTEGGDTQRQQAIMSLTLRPDADSRLVASFSGIRYGLTLFNDFTFQKLDPVNGDEIEQDDQRVTLAANLRYERELRLASAGTLITTLGLQYRGDEITASLNKVHQRARLAMCLDAPNPCVSTLDRQTDAAAYVQLDYRPLRQLRLVGGFRTDLFEWDVHSLKPDNTIDKDHPTPYAPSVQRSIQSPKLSAVLTPIAWLDVYANFGSGFHSNDARSVVETGGAGALPRALGYEGGARVRLFDDKVTFAAVAWLLDLESELVWNGDDGGTSPSDATRRIGADFEARWQIVSYLYFDADVSVARNRYKTDAGNGNAIALAPPLVATGGLTLRHPSGLSASLRMRHIAERPGSQFTAADGVPQCTPAMDASTEAGQRCYLIATGYTVFDAEVEYTTPRYALGLIAENLTNADYREAQFGNITQITSAPPAGYGFHDVSTTTGQAFVPETHPVQDIHYTPGNPFGLTVTATLFF